jgi:hypothetical protein
MIVSVMNDVPASVNLAANFNWAGLLLVRVTVTPPGGGAWPRDRLTLRARFLPIETESVMPIPAVLTDTATDPNCDGVLKPDGTFTEILVLPVPAGWNSVVLLADPAVIVTGDSVMVPTPAFPLVIETLTGLCPETACAPRKVPLASSTPAMSVRVVRAAPGVVDIGVPNPNGPAITIPEGASVIVPVALPKPLNVAV